MSNKLSEVDGRALCSRTQFMSEVVERCQPAVMRGLVSTWPVVHAATRSASDLRDYLARFDNGSEADAFVGDPAIAGKYYYAEGLKGFNFERRRMRLIDAVTTMVATMAVNKGNADMPTMYVGSLSVEDYLPGFASNNELQVLERHVVPRIWLGHPSNVSAHFDAVDNVACVVAGSRRFTLFPPDAIGSLYVGPLDNTMAGQPVSLAASSPLDPVKYPRFAAARSRALCAELGPGDAIYIPKLWWHQVESTAPFNALVNYWWDAFALGSDAPYMGLLLSMMTIAERPAPERQAWKAFFDHYVFRSDGHPLAHLPPEQHGLLGPLMPDNYARIRAIVMRKLRDGF
jgi:hypothetical protein